MLQLRGEAGPRQVSGARTALAENGGGVMGFDEAACSVHDATQNRTAGRWSRPRVTRAEAELVMEVEPEARGGESRREAVLDTAAAMFAAKGYAGTSIRSITTSVGMFPAQSIATSSPRKICSSQCTAKAWRVSKRPLMWRWRITGDPWQALRGCLRSTPLHPAQWR